MRITKKHLGATIQYDTMPYFIIEGFEKEKGKLYVYGQSAKEGARPDDPQHPQKKYYVVNQEDANDFRLIRLPSQPKTKKDADNRLRLSCGVCTHLKTRVIKLTQVITLQDFLKEHSDVKIEIVTKEKAHASHH